MINVKVQLSKDNSFEMRKMLSENRFAICLFNTVTNDSEVLNEDYSVEKIIYVDVCLSFVCIYRERKLPPQKVLNAIFENFENGCVINYAIKGEQQ